MENCLTRTNGHIIVTFVIQYKNMISFQGAIILVSLYLKMETKKNAASGTVDL